ncbi:MAG: FHA domain-containing protein [Candidatus Poribacteria bacterium]|nr:FHA domain-containing protein [Candidatus Poribacteria bacterium]
MRFLRKTPKNARYSDADIREAEILEAYTCWLKNEKLSRKQKGLLKNIQGSTDFHKVKDLIDFAHYRFQETESVTPLAGSKERVAEKLMDAIKSETQIDAVPQPAYSPEAMGNVDTDVLPNSLKAPSEEEMKQWNNLENTAETNTQTLAHLNLSFEVHDDEVSITDLGSPTPVYVGGIRVNDSAPIQEGAEFKCGDITFQIVDIETS